MWYGRVSDLPQFPDQDQDPADMASPVAPYVDLCRPLVPYGALAETIFLLSHFPL